MTPIAEARAIQKIALARGISTHELAKRSGIAATTIYRLFNGDAQSIRTATLYSLAQALGATVEELRRGDEVDVDGVALRAPTVSDACVSAPVRPQPAVSGRVPLYRLSQVGAMARGDDEAPQRSVPPPPFDDYRGLDLIAVEVPPGRQGTDEPAPGDVLYVRPWKAEETPDPMDQDMVLAVRETGSALFTRWGLTPPEGVRPYGRVVCFARSWI